MIVLLAAQFITLFNQTALEVQYRRGTLIGVSYPDLLLMMGFVPLCPVQTMVTPLTQRFFGYGELENSIMYCLCGVEVIAGFLFVRWLSRRVAERVVLAIGLTICNISGVWCLIFMVKPLGSSIILWLAPAGWILVHTKGHKYRNRSKFYY